MGIYSDIKGGLQRAKGKYDTLLDALDGRPAQPQRIAKPRPVKKTKRKRTKKKVRYYRIDD